MLKGRKIENDMKAGNFSSDSARGEPCDRGWLSQHPPLQGPDANRAGESSAWDRHDGRETFQPLLQMIFPPCLSAEYCCFVFAY